MERVIITPVATMIITPVPIMAGKLRAGGLFKSIKLTFVSIIPIFVNI